MKAVAKRALTSVPPDVVDLAIAAAVTWFSLSTAASGYPRAGVRPFDAVAVGLTVAVGAVLAVRRRFPLAVMTACAVLVVVFEARGYWLSLNQLGLEIALFTVASLRGRRWAAAAAIIVCLILMHSHVHEWVGLAVNTYLGTAVEVLFIAVLGDGARKLRQNHGLMAEYSAQLQRKQRDREQRAVLLERIRIARELHDVTAHHLSVIAVQAGLARYVLESDKETADHALRTISEVGSEGLAELRRLISLLRPEDEGNGAPADDRPAPGIGQLPILIERVGLSGTPSRYTVSGHRRTLPAGIELCVYRVVQESLTNVLRHAPGSSVDVRLEYAPEEISVVVTDTGPHGIPAQRGRTARSTAAQATEHSGSGVGLTGMRERASLYGGELSAGQLPDGGFEVSLRLPLDPAGPEDGETHAEPEARASLG